MSTRTLAPLISSSSKHCLHRNVTLPRVALCFNRDYHSDCFASWNVRYVTCSHRRDCHPKSSAGGRVSKWLKCLPFYLVLVSNFAMGKPTRSTKNEPWVFKYLLNLCVSKLEVFTRLPPAYHENSGNSMVSCRDFLYLTQANSQVCFKWMSKCVI